MFDYLRRVFINHKKIAITGLSRSGKTAFITSFINQLISASKLNPDHLGHFTAAKNHQIIKVELLPNDDLAIPRFPYELNLEGLRQDPPQWPQPTSEISQIKLKITYRTLKAVKNNSDSQYELYLSLIDYPGEWLVDLSMLDLDYQQWSQMQNQLINQQHRQFNEPELAWQDFFTAENLSEPADQLTLSKLAQQFTHYLEQAKLKYGYQFVQPGRFLMPGTTKGAPILEFVPLTKLSAEQWQQLSKTAPENSYFKVLSQRYQEYLKHFVKGFYDEQFSEFDRQVVLVDCITPLNFSRQAFFETKEALNQIFDHFSYGRLNFWESLFTHKIDKLVFAASKADQITTDQYHNLNSLLHNMVEGGVKRSFDRGIDIKYATIAAIRSTEQLSAAHGKEKTRVLKGKLKASGQYQLAYPGEVPSVPPSRETWQHYDFAFDDYLPLPLDSETQSISHINMDLILDFLLNDYLN